MKTVSSLPYQDRERLSTTLKAIVAASGRVTTRWSVVTGPPGSGKSTLIARLRDLGQQVVDDPAREILEQWIRGGRSKREARSDYPALQAEILRRMLTDARAFDPAQPVVFDYALPDNLAFLTVSNIEWTEEHVKAACYYTYENVFLLEALDASREGADSVRTETKAQRLSIHALLRDIYEELDVPVTRVLTCDLRERVELVMKILVDRSPQCSSSVVGTAQVESTRG